MKKKRDDDVEPTAPVIALHDPNLWPLRMKRVEVAAVLRCSLGTLFHRIESGRFPRPDAGTWHRDVVRRYCEGGIKEFERRFERDAARKRR